MTDPPEHPPLSERERIQALLDAGRISQQDAELLFITLDDQETDQGIDQEIDEQALAAMQADPAAELSPLPPTPPEPPVPVVPLPPPPPHTAWEEDAEPREPDDETGVRHWLKLTGGCGDLSVTVDPNLKGLAFTGEGEVERHGKDYHLRTPSDWKGGNWLSKLRRAVGSLEVRMPEGYGLELGVFAGDGTIRGVRALRGKFTGGDLTVDGAEHIDLTVTSGDVTMKVRPTRGEGRLRATSGDVTLVFLAGSDVTVSGKATAGDIDLPQGFSRGRGFGTTELSGTLGAGRARLELRLTAGDIDIRTEETVEEVGEDV